MADTLRSHRHLAVHEHVFARHLDRLAIGIVPSTNESAISIDTPEYVSVAVTNTRSCREVSCTKTSNPEPKTLFEVELGFARMYEAELPMRMFALLLAAPFHRGATIRADLGHRDAIEEEMIVLAMGLECLDHEPLIGISDTNLAPHALR